MKAIWNDTIIAESDDAIMVAGRYYFPAESLKRAFFVDSPTQTICGWKGVAQYYTIRVGEHENPDAAWYYPDPKPAAEEIRGRVAFWRGVRFER